MSGGSRKNQRMGSTKFCPLSLSPKMIVMIGWINVDMLVEASD